MPAWGNHEWESPAVDDLRNYKGRLLMPNAQTSPGAPRIACCGDDWGWFDAGAVRFIAYPEPYTSCFLARLGDARHRPDDRRPRTIRTISYIVTYGHRPAYSTGYHPGDRRSPRILDRSASDVQQVRP